MLMMCMGFTSVYARSLAEITGRKTVQMNSSTQGNEDSRPLGVLAVIQHHHRLKMVHMA